MMRFRYLPILAGLGLCLGLSSGCMIDAGKLAGFSNPKLQMSYSARKGQFDLEAGTDFQGKAEGHYNPETHQIDALVEVGSQASPVVLAEGERAEHLVKLRQIEADMLVEMHRLVGENIKATGEAVRTVAKATNGFGLNEEAEGLLPTGILGKITRLLIGILIVWVLVKVVWAVVVKPLQRVIDGPPKPSP